MIHPNHLRILIAKSQGWTNVTPDPGMSVVDCEEYDFDPVGSPPGRPGERRFLPKYEGHEAVHSLKLSLTTDERGAFIQHMFDVIRQTGYTPHSTMVEAYFASPEQELEAFARTKGLVLPPVECVKEVGA